LNTVREYLVTKKYISSSKTAILGWSAGAELVAESVARAPSGTFGCAIADRGYHDMLRVNCKSIDVLSSVSHPVFSVSSVYTWIILDGDVW
jgi:dipeptidyl aminopeptidase/acylaminoacyl peptidase